MRDVGRKGNRRENEKFLLEGGGEIHLKAKTKTPTYIFFYSDGDLEQGVASFIYYLLNLFIF